MSNLNSASTDRFGLTDAVINQINNALAHYPEIEQAILYGSRAKGNYRPGSDIDLTLIGEALTNDQLFELEVRLDDLLLPYTIDLCRFETIQNPELIDHINRGGKNFYRPTP